MSFFRKLEKCQTFIKIHMSAVSEKNIQKKSKFDFLSEYENDLVLRTGGLAL